MVLADITVLSISPWVALLAAIPILLAGEWMVRRVPLLARFSIPAAVVSGMLVASIVLLLGVTGVLKIEMPTKVGAAVWTWITTTRFSFTPEVRIDVQQPFLIAFFTCVGLNASWAMAKKGSLPLLIFLLISTAMALVQNLAGAALAKGMGQSPLLGLLCGGVTLMGGFGTAGGWREKFEQAGFAEAGVVSVTAATFGVVVACIIGGPVASMLVRRHKLRPPHHPSHKDLAVGWQPQTGGESPGQSQQDPPRPDGFIAECMTLARLGRPFVVHLLILLICMKAGAWVSLLLNKSGVSFPVQMGAMVTGVILRNVLDAAWPGLMKTRIVELMSSVTLGVFLTVFIMSLDLAKLRNVAGPMLVLLVMQTILNAGIAYFVVFRLMGQTYDAAGLSAGYIGFGLGSTSNAVATLKAMEKEYGLLPRAMLITTIVGGFLIDLTNNPVIALCLWWLNPTSAR